MPRITVIIPALNAEQFIRQSVDSLQGQTFSDWHAVIINDGSTDDTGRIADELSRQDKRITVIHHPEPQGLSAARNTGLWLAEGEFVQFLDADDILLPHKFAAQVRYLERHPSSDVICGPGQYFNASGPVATEYPPASGTPLATLLTRNYILVNAALTRTRAIEKIGGFKESSSTRLPVYGCEDWDFWLRIAMMGGQIDWDDTTVVQNRWHGNNMSQATLLMQRSYVWVLEEATSTSQLLSPRYRLLLASQLFCRRALYTLALFERGETEKARREARVCALESRGPARAFFKTLGTLAQTLPSGELEGWAWSLVPRLTRRLGRLATTRL